MAIKFTSTMNQTRRVLFPLGIKLALIVVLILIGSIWVITSLMALMLSSELVRTSEDTNFTINSRAAAGIEERLYKIRSEALFLLDINSTMGENITTAWQLRNIFFERNPNIAAVIVPDAQMIINQQFLINNEISQNVLVTWLETEAVAMEQAKNNAPVLRNLTQELGINLLALFYPWQNNGIEEAAVVFFSPQNLSEFTAAGSNSTIVVNGDGDVLVHPDFSQVLMGANVSGSTYFEALKKESGETMRISYVERGNRIVAAGHLISFADAAVFSTLEYSLITEQIAVMSRRSIMLSMTILFLSILVTWFFSKSITNPIKKLMAAAARIKYGEFYLDLKPKSWDEIGVLMDRFIDMGQGLSQWEETRDLIGRYNKKEIMNKAMLGKLNFTGEYIKAVIMSVEFISFSDIPGKLNAQDSLELLNSFIAKMMNCIEKTGGVVDKIIGRRIIALWGVPLLSGDFSDEIIKSLESALLMRDLILEANSGMDTAEKPPFQMGCGIHSGEVLAGRIGAFQYNQYTVTGENVDAAVICGEVCGVAKTDIIISKAILDQASGILAEELTQRQFTKSDLRMYKLIKFTRDREK